MTDNSRFFFDRQESRIYFEDNLDIAGYGSPEDILTVFDQNTFSFFGKDACNPVIFPPGEKSKSWQSVETIIRKAISSGLGRDGLILGIGGGMICDLAAFSASLYMRGCRTVLMPTTLLAMVDAAIGGKTAINIMNYKNMVGTFYPAEEIRLYIGALDSLPGRELKSGLAEVIKTAMLGDAELFRLLSEHRQDIMSRDPDLLKEIVRRCITVKGRVVEEDFKETGKRAILNLGHTFAHALEAATGLEIWTHGEAVAWGLAKAVQLGVSLGVTGTDYAQAVKELLAQYNFNLEPGCSVKASELLEVMHSDKKKQEGKLRLVLQRGICDTYIEYVEDRAINDILK